MNEELWPGSMGNSNTVTKKKVYQGVHLFLPVQDM